MYKYLVLFNLILINIVSASSEEITQCSRQNTNKSCVESETHRDEEMREILESNLRSALADINLYKKPRPRGQSYHSLRQEK